MNAMNPMTRSSRRVLRLQDPSALQISTEISRNDRMFAGNIAHYLGVGQSALRCIQGALALVGAAEPRRILDLPCGHGRVLRTLRAAYPESEVTACDLDWDGVEYCAKAFGAVPVRSVENPEGIRLSGSYDLCWCGSLFTHLAKERWEGFLRLFVKVLAPGGVVVFTTHGRRTEDWLRRGKSNVGLSIEQIYGLTQPQVAELLESFTRCGFAYVDYAGQQGYGISVSSLPVVIGLVQKLTDLRVAACLEHGWDEHQDVVVCSKP